MNAGIRVRTFETTDSGCGRRAARSAFTLIEVMIAGAIFFIAVFAILGVVNNCLRNARLLQTQRVTAATAAPILYDLLTHTNQMPEGIGTVDMGDLHPDYEWTYDSREVGTNGWYQVDIILQRRHSGGNVESMMTFYVLSQGTQPGSLSRGVPR